jgi:uncharacterized protein (DUF58 family)
LDVIEFEHTPVPDVVIAMDLRKGSEVGSGRFTSLEYAVKIAAGIAERTMSDGGTVRLAGMGLEGSATIPSTGTHHLYAIFEALAGIQADRDESLSQLLLTECELIAPGSLVVCLVPALTDDLANCADLLSTRGIEVRVILLALPGKQEGANVDRVSSFLAVGAAVTVLQCSDTAMECRVEYEYAI